ncbi:MAG: UDP-N-acetylglucosamine 2-epimerase [Flavobacteriales bacterium]
MKKIAVITGTRAEYGLLRPIIQEIDQDSDLRLQLYVTAMHLSPEFGMTIQAIKEDNFFIDKKIEMLLSSDTQVGVVKSMGLGLLSFSEAFSELNPDMVLVLGDRSEILTAVISAYILGIPIIHLYGGDSTEGAYDEGIRHSISKMSYYHLTSTEVYKKRVIQLGESPERVFNVGAISVDNILNTNLLNKNEFEESIDFKLGNNNVLVTYHPVTLANTSSSRQFQSLLDAFDSFDDLSIIFTRPNSDTGSREVNKMIDAYVNQSKHKCTVHTSLGQLRYLSALKHVDMMIGNSSSGIVEAPSFNIPTINIGLRQKGRISASSVIDCDTDKNSIEKAIKEGYDMINKGIQVENPYYNGGATQKIMNVIKSDKKISLNKKFYDINF